MTMGVCQYLDCRSPLGTEFRFDGPGEVPLLALVCPEHEPGLREIRDKRMAPIMMTPVVFGLGLARSGGTLWVMPDWMRMVWWPPDPRLAELGGQE